jgi:hypothetical protein
MNEEERRENDERELVRTLLIASGGVVPLSAIRRATTIALWVALPPEARWRQTSEWGRQNVALELTDYLLPVRPEA